jgi:hypothetical protein
MVLQVLVKGTSTVYLLQGNLLLDHLLDVGLWDFELPVLAVMPVESGKEWVLLDLLSISLASTKSLIWVSVKEL